ncbi:MAG: MFS transporter [Rhizobiales bacterium]|nr:MFS transporter [Hyphomicrobiales bacterium]NRB15960.1 MFS transporter [Hyphomicrobiales bacterium]
MSEASQVQPKYRWVIVFASALVLAITMGVMVNGISVFFIPLSQEYGWQRGSIALINVSGLVGIAIGGVVMGKIADKIAIRNICIFGASILGICIILASFANALWQFYMLFFIAGLLGAGALFVPLMANVGNWFSIGAGLAVGIASAGQALGQGGVPFASAIFISNYGWRNALLILGILILATAVPLTFLIRQPQRPTTDKRLDTDADTKSPVPLSTNVIVIWMSAAVLFCCACMAVPLMHLVPLIQDKGFSIEQAGSVAFVMLLVAILGRVAFGKLADVIGAIPTFFIASFWQTVLVYFFIQFETLDSFYIFAVIYGFGYAGVMTTIMVCMRVLTPLAKRASALGIVMVFAWLGHGLGGYQGGLFFDRMGDYNQSYMNAALFGSINLILVASLYFTIRRRSGLRFAT